MPRRYWYGLIACLALSVAIPAYMLDSEYREQVDYWQEKLTRVAQTNQRLLENWAKERSEDARLLASFRCTRIAAVSREKMNPNHPPMWQQQLRVELNSVSSTYGYWGAYVLDSSGKLRSKSENAPSLPAEVIRTAVKRPQAEVLTILPPARQAEYAQLAFMLPIHRQKANGEQTATIGHVVLLTRAEAIPSLLPADLGAAASVETILLAPGPDQPVFISPLRHWRGAPPPPGTPAHIAVLQKRAFFGEYRDYRGVPVMAATRFVPALRWGMVIKVDRSDALSAFHESLILGISVSLLTVLAIVSLAIAGLRQQRIQRLQADLRKGKQTEEGLRQSEARFGVALQNSPVVVFNQDRDLRYTWIHNAQPPWSEQEYRGKTDEELIGMEDGSRLSALKRPVLETGIGVRKEYSLVYRGSRRYYDVNIQPLRNEGQEVVGITGAGTDITERKRVENQLQESEQKYRRLFQTTEAFAQTDMGGHVVECNPAYQSLLGYSADELARLTYMDITPARWHAREAEIIKDQVLRRGHSDAYEKEYRRKDGSTFPVELRTFLIRDQDNNPVGMWASVRDISERKRADKALRDSEGQLRAFIENAPYGMFRCAGDRFLSANPALVRMLGYQSEMEVLALNLSTAVFLTGTECEELVGLFPHGPTFGPIETRWRRRDGKIVLVRLRGRIATNGQEVIEAIVEDITQQRVLEEHWRQADKMEALGRLASGAAHDFNNVLLGITLNVEHVIQRISPADNLIREELEQALQAARSAASVTRQLLIFGRERPVQLQSVNLNEVVIRSQGLVKQLAGENVHVNVRLGQEVGKVRADPVEVQQVILNLVVNARDAMSCGGGQITLKTTNQELEKVPADEYFTTPPKAGNYVVLEVSDNGIGIGKEMLSHVFEPFFTTKQEGTGLGLFTSYGIVTQSGGYISVRTEVGQGTSVKLYLPRLSEHQNAALAKVGRAHG